MSQNKKDEQIRKMVERGYTDPKKIAQKLGYKGAALTSGIERVNEGINRLGIKIKSNKESQGESKE
jgi:hypothetical protein